MLREHVATQSFCAPCLLYLLRHPPLREHRHVPPLDPHTLLLSLPTQWWTVALLSTLSSSMRHLVVVVLMRALFTSHRPTVLCWMQVVCASAGPSCAVGYQPDHRTTGSCLHLLGCRWLPLHTLNHGDGVTLPSTSARATSYCSSCSARTRQRVL